MKGKCFYLASLVVNFTLILKITENLKELVILNHEVFTVRENIQEIRMKNFDGFSQLENYGKLSFSIGFH